MKRALRKTHLHFYTFKLLILLWVHGCTEPYSLDLNTDPPQLVVDAVISPQTTAKVIRLSTSVAFFSNSESPVVTGAKVTVYDEAFKPYVFNESEEYPGYYFIYSNRFTPIPGALYTLNIEQVDINQDGIPETYNATSEMPFPVKLDSIDLKYQYFNKEWEIWQVRASFQDPPDEKNNYMFRISHNGEPVTNRPNDIRISDDAFFDGNYVGKLWVQSIDARAQWRVLRPGDIISLEMAVINNDFYRFLDAIKKDEQGKDPLFSGPPANIPGNIHNGALGMFTFIAPSSADVVYNPDKHD